MAKKSSIGIKTDHFYMPNISLSESERNVKMSMKVKSMSVYSGVNFTFDSLMTKLSEEEEQHVVNFPHTNNLIETRKTYTASQMVDIAKKYYENGYKVFIFLRSSKSGYNLDIDFQKMSVPAGAASAASPFHPRKSQRSRSKSAKKRRNLKNKSKSKSKKRSPKPRRR
jgi:hypothetical protein